MFYIKQMIMKFIYLFIFKVSNKNYERGLYKDMTSIYLSISTTSFIERSQTQREHSYIWQIQIRLAGWFIWLYNYILHRKTLLKYNDLLLYFYKFVALQFIEQYSTRYRNHLWQNLKRLHVCLNALLFPYHNKIWAKYHFII